jgi:hypothetical protein
MTVAERCGMPPGGGPYETASEIVDRVLSLYSGILGRLAAVALQVEDSLAAETLKVPGPGAF